MTLASPAPGLRGRLALFAEPLAFTAALGVFFTGLSYARPSRAAIISTATIRRWRKGCPPA